VSAAEQRRALEQTLQLAKKLAPGSDAQVSTTWSREANTRFARSEITSNGDVDETRVELTLASGKRHASAASNQLSPEALRSLVERTARLTRLSPEDPELMPPLPPQRYARAAPAWDEATAALEANARAHAIVQAIAAADERKLELAGFYEHSGSRSMFGNSAGLFAEHAGTSASFSVTARTSDGKGSGWAAADSHRRSFDPAVLARTAMDKAVASARSTGLPPGRMTVVLEPAAVADLLEWMHNALDARPAEEGRSVFARQGGGTLLGDKLFADAVSLTSDPADPTLPTAPFDGEGLPLRRTSWIDAGVLRALHCSRYWAKKTGRTPLGAPRGLRLSPGSATTEELVRGTKRGLLVTRLWYLRMLEPRQLLVTGLTRDGVFRIEDGEIVGAVNNFRFNQSPVALLRNVEALGKDLFRHGDLLVPAVRAADFNLASVSAAS